MKNRTRKGPNGRTWEYNDTEGTWRHEEHLIGCGEVNGSKWQIWAGPKAGHWEYKTLKEAMQNC